jgi:CubicO group peptidase (beta-lactamase class C family)
MRSGGLSTARLGRMHDVLAGHVERGDLPGLVTLVSRRGEVHVDAIGTQAVGGSAPMRRDTIFRVASLTKPVVAVAAMILVEECRLRLDDPVDGFLPELADRQVLRQLNGPLDDTEPAARPITLRDLLTLRLGFGYSLELSDDAPIQQAIAAQQVAVGPRLSEAPGMDAWMQALGALPLMHQPGERWLYDTGADVLGVLVARAAGQPLEAFCHERIFAPLGMQDTAFSVPADKLDRLPPCYQTNPATGALDLFDDGGAASRWSRPPTFPSGGGGLVSTVDDYLAFGQMMLRKGKLGSTRILARPSVELMTTDHLTPEQRAAAGGFLAGGRGWGFGLSVITRREDVAAVPGRFGWDGGYGTSWYSDPQEDLVAILMTQWLFPQAVNVYLDFWTSVYQAIDD